MPNCEAEVNEFVQPEQLKQYPHGPIQSQNQSNQMPTPAEQGSEPMPRGEEQSQCILLIQAFHKSSALTLPLRKAFKIPIAIQKINTSPCLVLIGDSIIKNIIPQKLSQKRVHKYTYPSKTAEQVESEIRYT